MRVKVIDIVHESKCYLVCTRVLVFCLMIHDCKCCVQSKFVVFKSHHLLYEACISYTYILHVALVYSGNSCYKSRSKRGSLLRLEYKNSWHIFKLSYRLANDYFLVSRVLYVLVTSDIIVV